MKNKTYNNTEFLLLSPFPLLFYKYFIIVKEAAFNISLQYCYTFIS